MTMNKKPEKSQVATAEKKAPITTQDKPVANTTTVDANVAEKAKPKTQTPDAPRSLPAHRVWPD